MTVSIINATLATSEQMNTTRLLFPYVSLATLSKFSKNAALLVKMIVQQRFHLAEVTGIL